ncbi:MAG: hypothetical protein KAX39_00345 [candidate division Zixibacteria bacterium]|nr:hypothetical protein [candidate division Zixibacteria bacterium]
MKAELFFCALVLTLVSVVALPSVCQGGWKFVRTLGGTNEDWGGSVTRFWEEGENEAKWLRYMVTGGTKSFGAGDRDLLLAKYNQQGVSGGLGPVGWKQWVKAFGGSANDCAYSVIQTYDEGFVAAGYTNSFGAGGYDFLLAKFNENGNFLWATTLGGGGKEDASEVIETTSDHGLVIAGKTYSFGAGSDDILVAKFDEDGNLIDDWAKTIGGIASDRGHAITKTSDGGLVVTGWTYSFGAGGMDIPVIKLDANGNLLWAKTIGGSG